MKYSPPNLNTIFSFCSGAVLLGLSSIFGFLGMPTEMGLSILAGALGLAFSNIDKISEFSGAGFSAKMRDQVQAVIDKETEQEVVTNDNDEALSDNETAVLKALAKTKFTWRTLKGISKDSSLSESVVWETLLPLVEHHYVRTSNKRSTGEMIWSLTLLSLGYYFALHNKSPNTDAQS